ncbi:MAG: SIR2 family protein [Campylobacterales bacterium]|nr:SIR2 family protein [Campylobacterales bacterium]
MSNKLKQTLLFGNGLNHGIGKTWNQLLLKLKQGHIIEDDTLPNTMKYEQTLLKRLTKESNDVFSEEFKIKSEVKLHMDDLVPPKIYYELIALEFDNYITTNYDNIFEKAYQNNSINNIETSHISTELIYSIRRYKQLNNCKLWHIHGEINQPKSIMLGMDQYIGSISKIDDYIKGNYKFSNGSTKYSIEDKLLKNNFDEISWIELFLIQIYIY